MTFEPIDGTKVGKHRWWCAYSKAAIILSLQLFTRMSFRIQMPFLIIFFLIFSIKQPFPCLLFLRNTLCLSFSVFFSWAKFLSDPLIAPQLLFYFLSVGSGNLKAPVCYNSLPFNGFRGITVPLLVWRLSLQQPPNGVLPWMILFSCSVMATSPVVFIYCGK